MKPIIFLHLCSLIPWLLAAPSLQQVLGIGSEEVVTLITQQKEQKNNYLRRLGEDIVYLYWYLS